MSRRVNKLFDLEFDEVSSVDRPANQHGLIALSKSVGLLEAPLEQEEQVPDLFTEAGDAVDLDELEHGDVVYGADGQEFVFAVPTSGEADGEDEPAEDVVDEDEDDDEPEVEKGVKDVYQAARMGFSGVKPFGDEVGSASTERAFRAGRAAASKIGQARTAAANSRPVKWGTDEIKPVGSNGRVVPGAKVERRVNRRGAAALTATGVAAGGTVMASKSLGDSVLERLSKAVTDADRDEVVVKMADEVEFAKAQAQAATELLEQERDYRITQEFISKAAEYNLPVDPVELGPILKAVVEVLDEDQIDLLDRILTAAGDAIYDEIGADGGASSSIVDEVNTYAAELVGKSAGDVTLEQAAVAMFAANPGAYDAYNNEQNGR